jgi:hypothetical protein
MKIRAQDLRAGDVIALHDWTLHVFHVERDLAVAVLTAEFDFLLHFLRDELVDVLERVPAAA